MTGEVVIRIEVVAQPWVYVTIFAHISRVSNEGFEGTCIIFSLSHTMSLNWAIELKCSHRELFIKELIMLKDFLTSS